MNIQYLVDEHGRQTAVLIPIDEWMNILRRLAEEDDSLTPEETTSAAEGWKQCENRECRSIEEIVNTDD